MVETIRATRRLGELWAGKRLDQALAELFPEHSRSRLQGWMRAGDIRVDGRAVKPNYRVQGGEELSLDVTLESEGEVRPEPIPLAVLHEDDAVLVLDKPAGLVVHPAPGNRSGTLQNALLHHAPALAALPRAGIVHRLDKLTSGVMVVAKTLAAHTELVRQLQARAVSREYRAVVFGALRTGGTVDAPIGRHPRDRTRMTVSEAGKAAVTHFRILGAYGHFTLLGARLETGRTHQIRVHFAHLGHPLVGDPVYGARRRPPARLAAPVRRAVAAFPRQALHARHLAFAHPVSGQRVRWSAPWPTDLETLAATLAAHDAPEETG